MRHAVGEQLAFPSAGASLPTAASCFGAALVPQHAHASLPIFLPLLGVQTVFQQTLLVMLASLPELLVTTSPAYPTLMASACLLLQAPCSPSQTCQATSRLHAAVPRWASHTDPSASAPPSSQHQNTPPGEAQAPCSLVTH